MRGGALKGPPTNNVIYFCLVTFRIRHGAYGKTRDNRRGLVNYGLFIFAATVTATIIGPFNEPGGRIYAPRCSRMKTQL